MIIPAEVVLPDIYLGREYELVLRFASGGVAMDFTGTTHRMQIRAGERNESTLLLEPTLTLDMVFTVVELGAVTVTIPKEISALLSQKKRIAYFEYIILDAAGKIQPPYLKGTVELNPYLSDNPVEVV